jgi:glutaminyl-peptide cyclotransferase
VTKNAAFITACAAAVLATLLAVTACRSPSGQDMSRDQPAAGRVRQLRAEVVRSYPHDPAAFTQGLVLAGGVLYESTGLEGRSSVRRVEPATGRVLTSVDVPRPIFGEGLAAVSGTLIQLTWTSETALVYDQQTLALLRRVPYTGEGWGLCYDGTSLVMSDGSAALTYRRPDSLAIEKTIAVTLDGVPQRNLNELECVEGSVYANVWHRDFIVRLDPASGRIVERIDASGLLSSREGAGADVLNGIAYDPADGLFYVTGKLWPRLFKVRFVNAPGAAP